MRQDRFIIVTADSQFELNWTFSAAALHPGSVDPSALGRRSTGSVLQRFGDGQRTPGPFVLSGHVWNDGQDARAIRTEIVNIQAAVAAAQSVLRDTPTGQYWYSGFQGGPSPEVTPDGIGGYRVRLEFWPSRAEFVPLPPANARPLLSRRTPSDTFFPEYFLARGPRAVGDTGSGSARDYVTTAWALSVATGSRLVSLWRQQNDAWEHVETPGHPIIGQVAPAGSRRFSLAFDQAAQPTVAYEQLSDVHVTRYDSVSGGYVQNVSVPGVDPILVLDAAWHGSIGGSDLLLFHLSADRTQVIARVQSEIWATPHTLHNYGVPVILDRVVPLPFRYQLLLSDATGEPQALQLLSDFYPVPAEDNLGVVGYPPASGSYVNVVMRAGDYADSISAAGLPPSGGAYAEAIELLEFGPDAVSATGLPPSGGAYAPAMEYVEPDADAVTATGLPPTGGEIVNVTIRLPNEHLDELEVTAFPPSGGAYELA